MLGRPFIDTDDLIGETEKKYRELGEEAFRELEHQAIVSLKNVKNSVISLGGGVVLRADTVALLQKLGEMIYLEASFETLRIGKVPAFAQTKSLQEIYHVRKPIYESISARKINIDQLDEAGVLAALVSIVTLEDPPDGF